MAGVARLKQGIAQKAPEQDQLKLGPQALWSVTKEEL